MSDRARAHVCASARIDACIRLYARTCICVCECLCVSEMVCAFAHAHVCARRVRACVFV